MNRDPKKSSNKNEDKMALTLSNLWLDPSSVLIVIVHMLSLEQGAASLDPEASLFPGAASGQSGSRSFSFLRPARLIKPSCRPSPHFSSARRLGAGSLEHSRHYQQANWTRAHFLNMDFRIARLDILVDPKKAISV